MTSDIQTAHPRKPRHGDRFEVAIERLDAKGQGVGTIDWPPFESFSVAVRHANPGSTWLVEVVRRRSGRLDARKIELVTAGPHGATPRCPHFGTCGGCSFQNLAYERQLVELRGLVERPLVALGLIREDDPSAVVVEAVVGMEDPFHYRNKMDFTFGTQRWVELSEPEGTETDFALGLHVPFRHDKVLDIHECSIAFPEAARIVNSARRLAGEQGLSAWDLKLHQGLLRHLVVRKGFASGEVLVYLVTSEAAPELVQPFVDALVTEHPEIATLVQGVHGGKATVAWGEEDILLHGPGSIEESLLGHTFRVQPKSFFQTNTEQAERLIEIVREEVLGIECDSAKSGASDGANEDTGGHPGGEGRSLQTVFDLYCGTGLLGLMVTPKEGRLIGIEKVASSVQDARLNAQRLGHEQAIFLEGDVLEHVDLSAYPEPDVVIVDPPRAGLHPKMVPAVSALPARRLVYVACNVKNAARDIAGLVELGWSLRRVRPVDLFPHTPHVECVFTLERS